MGDGRAVDEAVVEDTIVDETAKAMGGVSLVVIDRPIL